MDTQPARITDRTLDVVDGEIVTILKPTGKDVSLARWRELVRSMAGPATGQPPLTSWSLRQ